MMKPFVMFSQAREVHIMHIQCGEALPWSFCSFARVYTHTEIATCPSAMIGRVSEAHKLAQAGTLRVEGTLVR
jgi:hypothetical protein